MTRKAVQDTLRAMQMMRKPHVAKSQLKIRNSGPEKFHNQKPRATCPELFPGIPRTFGRRDPASRDHPNRQFERSGRG
jgi:hypothetical protein